MKDQQFDINNTVNDTDTSKKTTPPSTPKRNEEDYNNNNLNTFSKHSMKNIHGDMDFIKRFLTCFVNRLVDDSNLFSTWYTNGIDKTLSKPLLSKDVQSTLNYLVIDEKLMVALSGNMSSMDAWIKKALSGNARGNSSPGSSATISKFYEWLTQGDFMYHEQFLEKLKALAKLVKPGEKPGFLSKQLSNLEHGIKYFKSKQRINIIIQSIYTKIKKILQHDETQVLDTLLQKVSRVLKQLKDGFDALAEIAPKDVVKMQVAEVYRSIVDITFELNSKESTENRKKFLGLLEILAEQSILSKDQFIYFKSNFIAGPDEEGFVSLNDLITLLRNCLSEVTNGLGDAAEDRVRLALEAIKSYFHLTMSSSLYSVKKGDHVQLILALQEAIEQIDDACQELKKGSPQLAKCLRSKACEEIDQQLKKNIQATCENIEKTCGIYQSHLSATLLRVKHLKFGASRLIDGVLKSRNDQYKSSWFFDSFAQSRKRVGMSQLRAKLDSCQTEYEISKVLQAFGRLCFQRRTFGLSTKTASGKILISLLKKQYALSLEEQDNEKSFQMGTRFLKFLFKDSVKGSENNLDFDTKLLAYRSVAERFDRLELQPVIPNKMNHQFDQKNVSLKKRSFALFSYQDKEQIYTEIFGADYNKLRQKKEGCLAFLSVRRSH